MIDNEMLNAEDYTIEYCPWCDQDVAIYSTGITACPNCGKPLAPCSVCYAEGLGCRMENCPYGCSGYPNDEFKRVTNRPITPEEIAFAFANC